MCAVAAVALGETCTNVVGVTYDCVGIQCDAIYGCKVFEDAETCKRNCNWECTPPHALSVNVNEKRDIRV